MDLGKLDSYKEGNRLEAKEAQGGLPRSIWASVSAFASKKAAEKGGRKRRQKRV